MADNNNSEDIILNIQVRNSDALRQINLYNEANYQLKKTNQDLNKQNKELEKSSKELNKEVGAGTKTRQEAQILLERNRKAISDNIEAITRNTQEITANNNASRVYQRELQNNIKIQQEKENSLVQLRAKLSNATAAFDRMSDAERETAKGKELQAHINEITDSLKETEESTQRFYRNVGNYEESIISAAAGNNKFAQSLLQSASAGKGMSGIIDLIKGKVQALFAVIIANPVMAVIAAIVIVFMALKKVIDSNEESTQKLNKILAPLKTLLESLFGILQKLVSVWLDGVTAVIDFYLGLMKLAEALPIVGGFMKEVNKHIEESIELEERKAALEKRTRAEMVSNAKNSRDIAKLRAEAEDKLAHTAEKRLQFMKDANKLEKENADNALAIAKEKLALAEEEAKLTLGSTENEKNLASLRADVYKAEEEHFNKIRGLRRKEATIHNEIVQEQEKAAAKLKGQQDKANAKAKEYREKELAAQIAIQNAKYNADIDFQKRIVDSEEKSHKERLNALLKYNAKQIEAVVYNRDQELKQANLTASQKELILINSEQKLYDLQIELRENTLKLLQDKEAKELDVFEHNLHNKLEVVKQGTFEELNLRLTMLQKMQDEEIKYAEKTGADISLIREKYRQLEIQAQEEQEAYFQSQRQKEFDNKILEAELEGQNTLAIQLEQKTAQLEALAQLENETDIDFFNRKLQLQNELKNIEDEYLNYQLETRVAVMQATSTIAGGFQELFESMAEDNAAFAGFAKAMALYQIGVDTATALTAGVKQAQSVPFPGNIAAIATTVATILSNIAKAKKYLTSSKEPKAPKFNQGGLVTGEGSGTSDSIRAYLSNGESVMTARTTAMFSPILSAFNQIGGGVPISTQDTSNQVMGEEMLSRAFAKAVLNIPNPVVSVQEIDNVNNRIEVLEKSRSL